MNDVNVMSEHVTKNVLCMYVGPLIFRDRGKRTEFAESALWNGKRDFRKFDFFFLDAKTIEIAFFIKILFVKLKKHQKSDH